MGARFDVEYDDFSGGHFVGAHANKQPMNTWTGVDVVAEPGTGYLMANDPWYKSTAATVAAGTNNIIQSNNGVYAASPTGPIYVNSTTPMAAGGAQAFTAGNTPYTPTTGAPNGWGGPLVLFNNKLVVPAATPAGVIVMPLTGPPSVLAATPQNFTALGVYDYWLFGAGSASALPNRAYWCNPQDPTAWSSANYYDVGDPSNTITVILAHQGQVYFGGTQGWYVGIGVPGSTFALRKINGYPAASHAVDADTRVLTPCVLQQALLAEVAGQSVIPVDWAGAATGFTFNAGDNVTSRLGPYVFVIAGVNGGIQPTNVHILNLSTRTWHIVSNPSDAVTTGLQQIASGQDPTTVVVAHDGANMFCRYAIPAFPRCGFNFRTNQFTTATAALNDFFHKTPFRVRKILVDVEADSTTAQAIRQLSVRAITNFQPDQPAAIDPGSSILRQTFQSSSGQKRQTMEFDANDALPGFWAAPELTMQGLKVRRVIMRCEEAKVD